MKSLVLLALALAGCAAATPALDKHTGTTLADRCMDYRLVHASYLLAARERTLTEWEVAARDIAALFIATHCTAGSSAGTVP